MYIGCSALRGVVVAVAFTSAHAIAGAQQESAEQAVQVVRDWARSAFELPPEQSLDPDLRERLDALLREHWATMEAQWPRWVTEDLAGTASSPGGTDLIRHLLERFVNELALWRVDRVDERHDRVWLAAIERSTLCRNTLQNRPFASLAAMLQELPPDQRAEALAAERELLSRWGSSPRAVPARPMPSAPESLAQALPTVREGEHRYEPPMWPMVAWWLHTEKRDEYKQAGFSPSCAIQQWWALQSMRSGALSPSAALQAWRYALAPQARDWLAQPKTDGKPEAGEYSAFARRHEIEGKVTVELELDAKGRIRATRVAKRDITVGGVRGVPAVAFETELDEASQARSRTMEQAAPSATEQLRDGTVQRRVSFVWRLQ